MVKIARGSNKLEPLYCTMFVRPAISAYVGVFSSVSHLGKLMLQGILLESAGS